ncbi:MAG: penicillin-binding protein activator [Rhodobacteraceae bacterium]|nr:penicillin-binding protein activator [Paracoccaceae bacterium]
MSRRGTVVFHKIRKIGLKTAGLVTAAAVLWGCTEVGGGSQGPRVNTNKPVVVGILVPSGSGNQQQEALAGSLVAAAKMAVAEMGDVQIDLRVYPTAGDSNRAAAAAQRAASEGAKILVGPLFAQAANAAGTAVASQGINVLSFSNNPDIAGGNVFILGDTFANTADRVVGYAARKGQRSVAALVRADAAGDVAAAAVQTAARNNGASFVGVAKYELTSESAIAAVSATKSLIERTGATALVLDADAAGALPVFAQMLPEKGVTSASTQFIGLTRWDQTAPAVRSSAGLQGSLFALNDTSATRSFNQRYAAAHGSNPHLLAGKAYDAMRAVGSLLQTGSSDALTRKKLTRNSGFQGANGIFRLRPDGTNQRALAVATFQEGNVVVLDPAPRSFGGSGS